MIKHGIGLISGVALALAAVTLPGPASTASPAQGAAAASAPVAWVVNQSLHSAKKGSVTPIDTATNTAGKNIKVGVTPGPIVIAPDGKTAYVLNLAEGEPGKGTVTPINTAANTAGKPIPLKHAAFPPALNLMVITPNGKTLYAAGNTTLTPIDTATSTARRAIRVAPRNGFDITTAITPDGRTVYVGGALAGTSPRGFIVPVSTATGRAGKAIIIRGAPSVMAVTPDGKTLYVLCAGNVVAGAPQEVVPVNTATNTAGRPINTGLQPTGIAITGGHQ